jgi:hypothetical protein
MPITDIKEGIKWLENKMKKIESFETSRWGIMDATKSNTINSSIDQKNNNDPDIANATTYKNNLAQGLGEYSTNNRALTTATNDFLAGSTAQYGRNYNVYVNQPVDLNKITATPYNTTKMCVQTNISSDGKLFGLTDAGATFTSAYPDNFSDTPKGRAAALNACKLWAADTQVSSGTNPTSTYFGITKDDTNKFKCYTGNSISGTPEAYRGQKVVAYTIASSLDSNKGRLFYDGTIGVYNSNGVATSGGIDPRNTQVITPTPLTNLPDKFSKCDKYIGGSIVPSSINASLGLNCSTSTENMKPLNIRTIKIQSNGDWLQISRLAVFANVEGRGMNVAPNGTATATSNYYSHWTNPNIAIKQDLGSFYHPNIFHSARAHRDEYWTLDLGREYLVYQIVYYNRNGCCSERANGMKITFYNGNNAPVYPAGTSVTTPFILMNSNQVQTYAINSAT